jgi:predicted lipoprotein
MVLGRSLSVYLLALAACGDDSPIKPDGAADGFDRNALLAHLATDVLLPIQANAATAAAALPSALNAYCTALDTGSVGTTLDSARAAFTSAIDAWESAEAVLVGPAAMDNKALRGLIYSWPLISPCELDRDTASRWADPNSYDLATELVNSRSLSAIEFLLYPPNDNHNCTTTPPGWTALGADLPRARCRLALVLATDVAAQAQTLSTAWKPDGGNYAGELAKAGTGDSSIATAQAAVNLVSDGLFYLDSMTKGMKLGESSGILVNACQTVQEPCVREVELRYADRSTISIRRNLAAFRQVFTGTTPAGDGVGFDDYLAFAGHKDLADRMVANLDAAIAKATALPDSFLGALTTDYASVTAAYHAVDAVTDDLKSQFLTVLALDIPDDVATDND